MLAPDSALPDAYGVDRVYVPATSFSRPGWVQGDRELREFRTGDHLLLAGDMPVVCHGDAATPRILGLMGELGLPVPRTLLRYTSRDSYEALVRDLGRGRAIVQHAHPPEEIDPGSYWIPRDLLCRLNNKGNLASFVPPEHLPSRRVVAVATLRAQRPAVVKAVTDESSGGGRAVRICRSRSDVEAARDYFSRCSHVVVEEFLSIDANLCIQFAARADGAVVLLGCSEQITTPEGRYLGNWFDAGVQPPPAAVAAGRSVMERAATLGYRGIAGFDVAVCGDGRVLVYDLNFRLNGSTAPLLLSTRLGTPAALYFSASTTAAFPAVASALRDATRSGTFLPLALFDRDGSRLRYSGIAAGHTREEASANAARILVATAAHTACPLVARHAARAV